MCLLEKPLNDPHFKQSTPPVTEVKHLPNPWHSIKPPCNAMHGDWRARQAELRQFSSERDVGSEIKCLSGENLDCKQWPSRRSGAERGRGRRRERCYTIAKCVYLEGNSGGSKMKGESDQFMLNPLP